MGAEPREQGAMGVLGHRWSSVRRWVLCCVAGWKGRRYRVELKGYFLFVFFCLFLKPLPPRCHL